MRLLVTEKIHYEDNIFFLTMMIRTTSNAIKLNIDADYFADKVLEDCFFISSSIQKIYISIKDNKRLIRRNIYLHSVMQLKKVFNRLIEDILSLDENFSSIFKLSFPKLRRMTATHLDEIDFIRKELGDTDEVSIDANIISYEEMHYLMEPLDKAMEN